MEAESGIRRQATAVSIRVAVCTNREPAAVRPCLDALEREGADFFVVGAGPGGAFPGARAGPGPGPPLAPNRRVGRLEDGGIPPFVGDGGPVWGGWPAPLGGGGGGAGERPACIGGPILPRFPAG